MALSQDAGMVHNSINVISHINGLKYKHCTIVSNYTENSLQNSYAFVIKVLERLGLEKIHFNLIKPAYYMPTANSIFNIENFKAIPLKSERKQDCQLSLLHFNFVLEALARAIRQVKEIKEIQIGNEDIARQW